ncbi:unnamed protein product [Caenorhabditis sp. 36 PRJEB53466]|nr:unnamed protein product [Caenorhabditis sp. 36 PRJEB53466]
MLFLFSIFGLVHGNHFTFDPTSRVSTTENWLNDDIPCIGDRIRFDDTLPIVAFMDHNLNAESITLPENGMIVFSDNGVEFGGNAHWQCRRTSDGPKDAFFSRDESSDTSFYNPKNWIPDDDKFLHMNQVPSEHDDVTISSLASAQIYLDRPVVVNNFQFYKRQVSLVSVCVCAGLLQKVFFK